MRRGLSISKGALRLHTSAVLMLCAAPASIPAAPPAVVSDSSFTATSGTISGNCPTGETECGTAVTGSGFFQRAITISGVTYYQTIVLPAPPTTEVSAPIVDCNYLPLGEASNRIDVLPDGPVTLFRFDPSCLPAKR